MFSFTTFYFFLIFLVVFIILLYSWPSYFNSFNRLIIGKFCHIFSLVGIPSIISSSSRHILSSSSGVLIFYYLIVYFYIKQYCVKNVMYHFTYDWLLYWKLPQHWNYLERMFQYGLNHFWWNIIALHWRLLSVDLLQDHFYSLLIISSFREVLWF